MSEEIKCQVKQRTEDWPYVERCYLDNKATHVIANEFRYGNFIGNENAGIEYICERHAEDLVRAYGTDSVRKLVDNSIGDSESDGTSTGGELEVPTEGNKETESSN